MWTTLGALFVAVLLSGCLGEGSDPGVTQLESGDARASMVAPLDRDTKIFEGKLEKSITGACAREGEGYRCVGATGGEPQNVRLDQNGTFEVTFEWEPTDIQTEKMHVYLSDGKQAFVSETGRSPIRAVVTLEEGTYRIGTYFGGAVVGSVEQTVMWRLSTAEATSP